jgi:glutamine amidotransferase
MISIIDYDAGNIKSVAKALEYLGQDIRITDDPEIIMNSSGVILPGVGAFGDAMNNLRTRNLENVIKEYVKTGKPFLGICLGLQLIFEESEESPGVKGLGLLKGKIKKIPAVGPDGISYKVPQIGWNDIDINSKSKLLSGLVTDEMSSVGTKPYVYFVHSYYLEAENIDDVAATTEYGVKIHAAVESNNVMATQFHPEKSSDTGLKILKNYISMCK